MSPGQSSTNLLSEQSRNCLLSIISTYEFVLERGGKDQHIVTTRMVGRGVVDKASGSYTLEIFSRHLQASCCKQLFEVKRDYKAAS